MNIELKSIPIRDLISGYTNDPDSGVRAYGGKPDVRPPYQREFRYDEQQKRAVIETIMKGFPLNIMYWSVDADDTFEMIDGQQRTLSICEFYTHDFNIFDKDRGVLFFNTLTDEEKKAFLDYELTVYFCSGTDKEKLDWFRVINIAGEKLFDQELRNAVYVGPFVTDARRHFSKNGCPAYKIGSNYMNGKTEEQAYLETVLKWAARHDGIQEEKPIDKYMAIHQFEPNANKLWAYYMQIITWVRSTFPHYRKEMKGLNWGAMFDEFSENIYDIIGALPDTRDGNIYAATGLGGEYHLIFAKQNGLCADKDFNLAISTSNIGEHKLLQVFYDGNNSITDVRISDIEVESSSLSLINIHPYTDEGEYSKVKYMLWNGSGSLIPICKSDSVEY